MSKADGRLEKIYKKICFIEEIVQEVGSITKARDIVGVTYY